MLVVHFPVDTFTSLSRLFWYAVFETLAVIAMAMYVHQLYLSRFPLKPV